MTREGSNRKSRRVSREELFADIIEYGDKVLRHAGSLSEEELVLDDMRYDAILYRIQCVSEATTQLMAVDPDIRERHPELPWAQIKGISDAIRHAFRFTAPEVVWGAIASGDLQQLVNFARIELRQ